jgi:hypothetical protein
LVRDLTIPCRAAKKKRLGFLASEIGRNIEFAASRRSIPLAAWS